jgi:hypothetical protein
MSPEFMHISMEDAWDNPHERVRARNKPAVLVKSEMQSVAPLTSFMLTINDPGTFFFGTGDFVTDNFVGFIQNTIYTDPGVTITGSSLSPNGKTLTVNFDGLTAGKKAIFNIDLDSSNAALFPFPDYRLVLCGAPGGTGDPAGPPATVAATFTNAASPLPNTTTLTEMLAAAQTAPDFFQQVIRPAKVMDMVEVKSTFVPEPSTAILALSMAALASMHRRRLGAR